MIYNLNKREKLKHFINVAFKMNDNDGLSRLYNRHLINTGIDWQNAVGSYRRSHP